MQFVVITGLSVNNNKLTVYRSTAPGQINSYLTVWVISYDKSTVINKLNGLTVGQVNNYRVELVISYLSAQRSVINRSSDGPDLAGY